MKIAILPGDGIGPEIMAQAVRVLNALGEPFELESADVGGAGYAAHGHPLPPATLALAKAADAVLFGAVGDYQYDKLERSLRPEQAILGLRRELSLFANLRPAILYPELAGASTLKPEVVVANLEEGTPVPAELDDAVGVYAAIEAEVAEMDPAEARALLEEFGVTEPGLESVIAACYRALDLITFLTTGEDETRAWEVRSGAPAPEAAGVIHTDLQRGFIRADVISYDELVAAGSMDAAKATGKLRVEGKDYVVREGDILNVRFAV